MILDRFLIQGVSLPAKIDPGQQQPGQHDQQQGQQQLLEKMQQVSHGSSAPFPLILPDSVHFCQPLTSRFSNNTHAAANIAASQTAQEKKKAA